MNNKKKCILFFVKFPEEKKVKTRLGKDIGFPESSEIYKCFVLDLLKTLNLSNEDFIICISPKEREVEFFKWLGENNQYYAQKGNDLGERMENAFLDAFQKGYEKVIVIGSDSPELINDDFKNAFLSLQNSDSVIGPTSDGGYYLLGFNKNSFLSAVFKNVPWSTENVFKRSMSIFKKQSMNVKELKPLRDIDTVNDLKDYYFENSNTDLSNTLTFKKIEQLKIF